MSVEDKITQEDCFLTKAKDFFSQVIKRPYIIGTVIFSLSYGGLNLTNMVNMPPQTPEDTKPDKQVEVYEPSQEYEKSEVYKEWRKRRARGARKRLGKLLCKYALYKCFFEEQIDNCKDITKEEKNQLVSNLFLRDDLILDMVQGKVRESCEEGSAGYAGGIDRGSGIQ